MFRFSLEASDQYSFYFCQATWPFLITLSHIRIHKASGWVVVVLKLKSGVIFFSNCWWLRRLGLHSKQDWALWWIFHHLERPPSCKYCACSSARVKRFIDGFRSWCCLLWFSPALCFLSWTMRGLISGWFIPTLFTPGRFSIIDVSSLGQSHLSEHST